MKSLFHRAALILIAVCCFMLVAPLKARAEDPRTLLWRIEGKGLKQPSFLFGTMHLSDRRLFRFDDSVYRAIEQSEGLAIELNPDEMVAYFINKSFDDLMADSRRLDEILDEKDYRKYSRLLSDKLKIPASEITEKDILQEKNRWISDYLSKGEMPTFVDAYLYNIARRQGKWLGGIEDLADQAGLMGGVVDKSDIEMLTAGEGPDGQAAMEELIRLYATQDLAGIDGMINQQKGLDKSGLLLRRNVKMALRMDSMSHARTMFFAVGAAHLPGDSGVIRLLRDRGFTVSPVFSKRKIDADKYRFKEVPLPWFDVSDAQGYYTVKMPGNPASVKMYGLVDTKFLFDIFNMSGYCTFTMLSAASGVRPDSIFSGIADNIFKTGKHIPFRELVQSGLSGREYIQPMKGMYMRLRLFKHERRIYVAMAYAFKKSGVTSSDADRFFESFAMSRKPAHGGIAAPFRHVDSSLALSIASRAHLSPTPIKARGDEPAAWKVTTLSGSDAEHELYIMVNEQAVMPGYHISNDSVLLEEKFATMAEAYGATRQPYTVGGRRAILVDGEKDGASIRALLFCRGNRTYAILVLGDSAAIRRPQVAEIFQSVQLLPYRKPRISLQGDSAGSYATAAPSPFQPNGQGRIAFDSGSNNTYTVQIDTINRLSWRKSDSAFWAEQLSAYFVKDKDELIRANVVRSSPGKAREWIIRKDHSQTFVRLRLLLHGNVLYQLHVSGEEEQVNGAVSDQFFGQFNVLYPELPYDISTPRTSVVLSALQSEDQDQRSSALEALKASDISRQDLPKLQHALFQTYRSIYGPDTALMLNLELVDKIAVMANKGTIDFVRAKYPTLQGPDSMKRYVAVSLLSNIRTQESYKLLAECLADFSLPDDYSHHYLAYMMRDSLELLRTIYPKLLPLSGKEDLLVGSLLLSLYDSNMVTAVELRGAEAGLIAKSSERIARMKLDSAAYFPMHQTIRLLGIFNSERSIAALQEYSGLAGHNALREAAIVELARRHHPVDTTVISSIAADSSTRLSLYHGLKDAGRDELYPTKFRSRQHLAQALVYDAATTDDEEYPTEIRYLGDRSLPWRGKNHRFYLYQVVFDEERSFLGMAGGFDEGAELPADIDDISSIYWDELYKPDTENALFEANLDRFVKTREEAQ